MNFQELSNGMLIKEIGRGIAENDQFWRTFYTPYYSNFYTPQYQHETNLRVVSVLARASPSLEQK